MAFCRAIKWIGSIKPAINGLIQFVKNVDLQNDSLSPNVSGMDPSTNHSIF